MKDERINALVILGMLLVATSVACLFLGANGFIVALIGMTALQIYASLHEGAFDVALLLLALALAAVLGADVVLWGGAASVAIALMLIIVLCMRDDTY